MDKIKKWLESIGLPAWSIWIILLLIILLLWLLFRKNETLEVLLTEDHEQRIKSKYCKRHPPASGGSPSSSPSSAWNEPGECA